MPYCTRLIRQLSTRLLLLPLPLLLNTIVEPPNPMPYSVWLLSNPDTTTFLIVTFAVGSLVGLVCPQITAFELLAAVLTIVRSRVEPPTVFEPSIVTKSAPFSTRMARVVDPLIVGVT